MINWRAISLFVLVVLVAACSAATPEAAPADMAVQPSISNGELPVAENSDGGDPKSSSVSLPEPLASLLPTITPAPTLEPAEATSESSSEAEAVESDASDSATPPAFDLGNELTIAALRSREISGSEIVIEQTLAPGANYAQYIASYVSEGNKIYGLLTVPNGAVPEGGFPAIVFNHGYIPPTVYRTTERYVAYVDALARNGFVVFKIDMRGFGNSEGEATGAYFSPGYTIDAIAALKSLQMLDYVNPDRIGMWGHSMAGNLVLRAMLIEPDIKAGVIWAGAVYSYDDMARYAISDPSFRRDQQPDIVRPGTLLREKYGPPNTEEPFWQAVSLTEHIEYLEAPLQLNHAQDDPVVNIGYSQDLVKVLEDAGKEYEFYQYPGGGHNINSPYFNQAMQHTIEFFRDNL